MSVVESQVTQAQALQALQPGQTFSTMDAPAQSQELPVAQEATSQTEEVQAVNSEPFEIPSEAVQLSSGVYVVFNRLNRSISTDLTIKTFNNVNLDKKGNLITDNLNTKDQMNMAKSISEYHSTLVMQGVQLVGSVSDYADKMELSDNWARKLFRSGLVDQKFYDINDSDDVEFLFLRYYAFQNEDDWALLSQNTLNT